MRLDIFSIFPDFFEVLNISLVGKSICSGLLEVHIHDLRDHTHDRHRTVDDTPYGGGPGMVMKPEPWGEALDELLALGPAGPDRDPVLVVPTPSGRPFSQALAAELSTVPSIAFACGRYEGIDHRVLEWAATKFDVREISLGDYVLNGGEVAVLAMVEAIVRLVPRVLGNPESLVEESYADGQDGLLEYPVYTKPASWRGLDVPEVLLSGDHGRVDRWRRERSEDLTRRRRPDLLGATEAPSSSYPANH